MFGRAAYTAEDAAYYHHYSHQVLGRNEAQMFLCRVAAGSVSEEGMDWDSSIVKPPDGYDSIRGVVDLSGAAVYHAVMMYETNQLYAAYLITYRDYHRRGKL